MATSAPVNIPHPYNEVFRTIVALLPENKMKLVSADEAQGIIKARTKANLITWGENITVRLGSPDAGATTTMVIKSTLRFGLARGVNAKKNFATITNATVTALGD